MSFFNAFWIKTLSKDYQVKSQDLKICCYGSWMNNSEMQKHFIGEKV
jgi:hypothetical protein